MVGAIGHISTHAFLKRTYVFRQCGRRKTYRMNEVEERVGSFKKLNDDVCRVIPDLLLAVMNMLFDQYQKIKESEYVPAFSGIAINQQLEYIRDQAKALTHFTGMLPYRMPGDTNSRLVQMEILMH